MTLGVNELNLGQMTLELYRLHSSTQRLQESIVDPYISLNYGEIRRSGLNQLRIADIWRSKIPRSSTINYADVGD
jgi:hypothetical protein